MRGDETILPTPRERIRRRDLLIVEGTLTDILRVKEEVGLEIKPEFLLSDNILESGETELFEVMVLRDSSLIGRTLKSISFRQTYNLTVLAVNRHGETFFKKLSDVALKFGDVLLVQGNRKTIEPYVVEGEMLLLQDVSASSVRTEKRRWAIAAFVLFLSLSLSKIVTGIEVPLAIAVLLGVLLLLATKTVRYAELYSLIDFRLLVMIACMISFGTAMKETQADIFLANIIREYFGGYGPTAVLAGFFALTVFLTQPMSKQAAALVVIPVAIQTSAI
jgi:di/tricarboxylate transporter